MLRERLIFGTARLSGGPYASTARELIAICLDAGITAFDTAPSYGMGAAETLLGAALDGRNDVRIATKVGAPRPRWPGVRGWAKRARRLIASPAAPGPHMPRGPYRGPAAGYRFDAEAVHASLAHSLRALRRDALDLVLLHEARPEDAAAGAAALTGAQYQGMVRRIGYAHGGIADHRPPPGGWIAQTAPAPSDFAASPGDGADRVFHTILGCAPTSAAVADAARALPCDDPPLRLLFGGLLALHRCHPAAGLIVATTVPARLRAAATLLDRIEAAGLDR